MSQELALSCPCCKGRLGNLDWHDAYSGSCRNCQADFAAQFFPALTRQTAVARPQAIAVAEDSTCYFHAENQAEHVCDGCGRFLCAVCSIPSSGGYLCPSCIAGQKSQAPSLIPHRLLLDSAALSLALLPLLICPFTFITAPLALGMVVYGWKKPGSLIRGRQRWKQVLAVVIALVELGVWAYFLRKFWWK